MNALPLVVTARFSIMPPLRKQHFYQIIQEVRHEEDFTGCDNNPFLY